MSDKLTYEKLDLKQAITNDYLIYRVWIGIGTLQKAFSYLSLLQIVVMIQIYLQLRPQNSNLQDVIKFVLVFTASSTVRV